MATSSQSASARTVVLLRPGERKHLEKLAARERVSAGEILRRSLHSYGGNISASEEETLATLLHDMNSALDNALASIRSARSEIRENLDKITQLRAAQS
jgi:hypothetical protein